MREQLKTKLTVSKTIQKETEKKVRQIINLAPSEDWIEKVVEVHPMRQIAIMSVVQVVVLAFMVVSMYALGVLFK